MKCMPNGMNLSYLFQEDEETTQATKQADTESESS